MALKQELVEKRNKLDALNVKVKKIREECITGENEIDLMKSTILSGEKSSDRLNEFRKMLAEQDGLGEEVDSLVKTTLGEIEKVLSTRTVVGEPLIIQNITLIPLISVGFAFGAGGGSGKGEATQKGEGVRGGSGGGAWVKPVAVVIIDKGGVRIEPVRGGLSTAIERIGETIPQMIEKCMETCMQKWGERKKEG